MCRAAASTASTEIFTTGEILICHQSSGLAMSADYEEDCLSSVASPTMPSPCDDL